MNFYAISCQDIAIHHQADRRKERPLALITAYPYKRQAMRMLVCGKQHRINRVYRLYKNA